MPRSLSPALRRAAFCLLLVLHCLLGCQHGPTPSSGADPLGLAALRSSGAHLPSGIVGHPFPGVDNVTCPAYPEGGATSLPPPLAPSKTPAAGTAAGSFAVSPTGQATYTIPLVVPPGRLGMEPRLAIAYDSSRGEGPLGVGFALQGLSAITRCPSNMAQDGRIRSVRYDGDDKLCLDGLRLVHVPKSDGADGTGTQEWRTFPDTMRKVVSHAGADSKLGPERWTVYEKGGRILSYGATADSRAMATGGFVAAWHLSTEADRHGNAVDYTYQNEPDPNDGHSPEVVISRIDYTRHGSRAATQRVAFDYEKQEKRDTITRYGGGLRFTRSKLLKRIRTLTSGTLVRSYDLHYDQNPNTARERLADVQECAGDGGCKPKTSFTWSTVQSGFRATFTPQMSPPVVAGDGLVPTVWRWVLADVNGDGLDDIVLAIPDGEDLNDDGALTYNWMVALNNGRGFESPTVWLKLANPATATGDNRQAAANETWSITPMDYDQDGRTDLFIDTPNPRASSWPRYRVLRSDPEHERFVLVDTEVVHPDATPFDADTTDALATGKRQHYRFVRLGDLNGDGVADLIECLNPTADFSDPLAIEPGNPRWNVHVWEPSLPDGSGAGWDPTPIPITPIDGFDDCTVGLLRQPVADLEGDGVSEMVVQLVNGTFGGYRLEGKTWKETLTHLAVEPNPPGSHKIHFLDLNGDGLSDALVSSVARGPTLYPFLPEDRPPDFGPTAPADVPYHALNDGKFFSALNPTLSHSLLPIADNPHEWTDWWADDAIALDYNGDGRMDFAMPVAPSGDEAGIPSWFIFESSPTMKGNFSVGSVIDNLGAGDMTAIPLNIPTVVDGISGVPVTWFLPQVSDVRGRGRHDLVFPNPNNDGTFVVYLNGDPQDQLLTVTDGMHALDPEDPGFLPTVSIIYDSLVDRSITLGLAKSDPLIEKEVYVKHSDETNHCAYPRTCVVGPSRVVGSYTINDGQNQPRTFSVRYRDARYHRRGRGMLGFGERVVVDNDTGAGTAEFYDNMTWDDALHVFPFAGQVVESWSWGPAGAVPPTSSGQPGKPTQVELVYGKTTLEEVPTDPETYFTLPIGGERVRKEGTFDAKSGDTLEAYVRKTKDKGGTVLGDTLTVVSSFDPTFGDVLQQDTIAKGADFHESVTRTVENDTGNWLLGEVTYEESCSQALGATQCRATSRTFDGYGNVERTVTSDPNEPETQLTSAYYRDAFGNVKLTTASDVSGHYRTACASYEPEGIFPYATRNQAGHTSFFDFDPGLGVLRGTVDPNGLSTRLRHDGFGRLTEERHPDGSSATYALARDKQGGPNGDWWRLMAKTSIGGGPVSSRELDSLGRPVHAWAHVADTQSCHGSHCVSMLRLEQETAYDHLGRVTRVTVPWMEGDSSFTNKHADRYEYDAIGRVTEHVEPWGHKTTYTYDRNDVTATDWLGPTTREVDALGRTVKITDKAQGTVKTEYGPFSQPFSVTRFGHETTTTHRDAYGHVLEEDDPDRGTTITHYDGFGEVLSVDDAAGRHFAFTYDEIGRLIERDDTVDGETFPTTWAYDTAPHGMGKIAQVTSPAGHVDAYTYTQHSQPSTHRLTFGDTGESFRSKLAYDTLGRVSTVTYPSPKGVDPLTTRRDYDAFGNVVAVRDDATKAPYWSVAELDGAGRPTKEVLGNGVTVLHTYAPESGVIRHVGAEGPGSPRTLPLQSLDYDYDVGLRMTSRADNLQKGSAGPLSEGFGYDAIDRLTCVRSVWSPRELCPSRIDYFPNGNIKTKDGLAYTYDPAHPHAVQTVGAGSYDNDAVGNQIERPGATIAYTPFDLPERYVFSGVANPPTAKGTRFEYDGNQQRIRKALLNADGAALTETVYLDDLYERVRSDGDVQHRFYVAAGSAMVVLTRGAGDDQVAYALTDALGSVDTITDEKGGVVERRSYDAFGARRNPAGWGPWQGPLASGVTTVGFEGLETDDEAGLVNMRGRIYDPKIGRFLSTDPLVSRPGFAQSWNPYSYVLNSPLNFTDPSGFEDMANRWTLSDAPGGFGLAITYPKPTEAGPPAPPAAPAAAEAVAAPKDAGRDDTPAHGNSAPPAGPSTDAPKEAAHADTSSPEQLGRTPATGSEGGSRGVLRYLRSDVWQLGRTPIERSILRTLIGPPPASVVKLLRTIDPPHPGVLGGTVVPFGGLTALTSDLEVAETASAVTETPAVAPPTRLIARITPGALPAAEERAVLNTLAHIDSGTTPTGALATKWGVTFKNWAGDLPGPSGPASPFREFRVAPPSGTSGAGPLRIVTNSQTGEVFYTWTHYGDTADPAFVQVR